MRAGKDNFPKQDVPSRPICGWAGVSLSTYKKIMPWCKTEKTENEESSSVMFGAAYMAFQLTAPTSMIDTVKDKVEKVTEKAASVASIFRRRRNVEPVITTTEAAVNS